MNKVHKEMRESIKNAKFQPNMLWMNAKSMGVDKEDLIKNLKKNLPMDVTVVVF